MTTWNLLPPISAPMPFQMALDDLIFRRESQDAKLKDWTERFLDTPLLRFYFASDPWITVGYSTPVEKFLKVGVPLCRRLTGGGMVRHGNDLLFSIIASKDNDPAFPSVRVSYLKIHEALKKGYESLGHKTYFFRCDQNLPKGNDCFRFPIATDLGREGRKIAGGSQKRSKSKLLHQESVIIPGGYEFDEVIPTFIKGFEAVFAVSIQPIPIIPELLEEALSLAEKKYPDLTATPQIRNESCRQTLQSIGAL